MQINLVMEWACKKLIIIIFRMSSKMHSKGNFQSISQKHFGCYLILQRFICQNKHLSFLCTVADRNESIVKKMIVAFVFILIIEES